MAKPKTTRKNKQAPSPQAVKWHEFKASINQALINNFQLIKLISQYGPVIARDDFKAALETGKAVELTEHLNVCRVGCGTLNESTMRLHQSFLREIERPYESRSNEVMFQIETEVTDSLLEFNKAVIDTGHLDSLRTIIEETIALIPEQETAADETVVAQQ